MLFTVWKILIVILALHCTIVISTCVHSRLPNIEFITSNAITPYLKSSCHPHSTGGFNSSYFYKDYGMWLRLQAIILSLFFFFQICVVWMLTVLVDICVIFIISSIKIQRYFFQRRLLLSSWNPTYFPQSTHYFSLVFTNRIIIMNIFCLRIEVFEFLCAVGLVAGF
jgi:hypothetical protein